MAVLTDGQKFGLSSKSQTNKSVLYVKLTDSALRSLEEYLKNKAVLDGRNGPSVQFTDNGGFIQLPAPGDRGAVSYSFGISAEDGGPSKQGRTDFLMSTNNSTLTSLGSMSEILRVKASDDVYKRIGQKFDDVKLENEKKRTVLLDNKQKRGGGLSMPKTNVVRKVVTSGTVTNTQPGQHSQQSTAYSGLGPGRGHDQPRPAPAPYQHQHHSRPQSPMSRPPPPGSSPAPSPAASHSDQSRTSFPSATAPKPRPQVNTEIMKRPLRDRLIHLLAVRPYKKPELLLRMHKDGLKEKDKKNISQLLREVSDCRNNVYELRRSMWNEVSEPDGWPFWTEQDRAALRRRKPQNLTPPGSDTGSTSSGHSPSSTNPPSPPQITNPLKRHTNYYDAQVDSGPAAKKKRVSSYKRPGGDTYKSPNNLVAPQRQVSVSPRLELEYDKVEDDSAPDWGRWGQDQHTSPAPAPAPAAESPMQSSSQMQLAPNRNMDFLAAYTTIITAEQRQKYKAEFNTYYAKYRKLHNVLDQVSKRFAHLESKLKHAQKGSEDFKNVKARILQEYEKNKGDGVYQEARSSFQYLHEKLAHIKKLVHDYDTAKVGCR